MPSRYVGGTISYMSNWMDVDNLTQSSNHNLEREIIATNNQQKESKRPLIQLYQVTYCKITAKMTNKIFLQLTAWEFGCTYAVPARIGLYCPVQRRGCVPLPIGPIIYSQKRKSQQKLTPKHYILSLIYPNTAQHMDTGHDNPQDVCTDRVAK